MSELISIIVPIYNTRSYLEKCINSIILQTYTNLQIILVDDGSTDGSAEICDKYAEKDKRIKVIHKENGGLISARKAGLKVAEGELVGWVDSDDWVESDYFEQMISAQKKSHADIVAANHFHEIGEHSNIIKNFISAGVYPTEQLFRKLMYTGAFFEYGVLPPLWTKLFRKDLLKKIYDNLDNRIVIEDAAAVYPYIIESKKIYITDICGYHYIQRPCSMIKTECNNEKERIQLLINHLEKSFVKNGVYEYMLPQIEQYKKYLFLLRNVQLLEDCGIMPYGDITENSKLVIYGAGGVGQKVHKYFSDKGFNIVGWADQNYSYYQENGYNVVAPEVILKLNYDYILISVINENTANAIRNYLIGLGVPENKIKWFSDKVTNEKYTISF